MALFSVAIRRDLVSIFEISLSYTFAGFLVCKPTNLSLKISKQLFIFPVFLNRFFFLLFFYIWLYCNRLVIILLFWEFFTPVLTDGFSQKPEWQQVSSSLQDSSQYSGLSQQSYSLTNVSRLFLTEIWVTTSLLGSPELFSVFCRSQQSYILTNVSRLFLIEIWVTASLLKSPGLFSVFWPIPTML